MFVLGFMLFSTVLLVISVRSVNLLTLVKIPCIKLFCNKEYIKKIKECSDVATTISVRKNSTPNWSHMGKYWTDSPNRPSIGPHVMLSENTRIKNSAIKLL